MYAQKEDTEVGRIGAITGGSGRCLFLLGKGKGWVGFRSAVIERVCTPVIELF